VNSRGVYSRELGSLVGRRRAQRNVGLRGKKREESGGRKEVRYTTDKNKLLGNMQGTKKPGGAQIFWLGHGDNTYT